jgi:urea carboxylase-associated protein 2
MRGRASSLHAPEDRQVKLAMGCVMSEQQIDLDGLTPAQYRARYEALQAAARALAAAPPAVPAVGEIAEADVVQRESLPAGAYVALRVKRGDALRISNPAGTPGAALFLWNADETSERYNPGDTVKLQWTTNFTTGRLLFSDMGRVLASITADSGAGHDSLLGANTAATSGGGRNGVENLRLAAAKFGMTKRDVGPCMVLFSRVRTDAEGRFAYQAPPAGAMVELRAEMNLLVALSNTPHVMSEVQQATGPIEICVYHAKPAGAEDLARNFSAEARRGFINTDEVFAS